VFVASGPATNRRRGDPTTRSGSGPGTVDVRARSPHRHCPHGPHCAPGLIRGDDLPQVRTLRQRPIVAAAAGPDQVADTGAGREGALPRGDGATGRTVMSGPTVGLEALTGYPYCANPVIWRWKAQAFGAFFFSGQPLPAPAVGRSQAATSAYTAGRHADPSARVRLGLPLGFQTPGHLRRQIHLAASPAPLRARIARRPSAPQPPCASAP